MANIKELEFAIGRVKQADLVTRVADVNLVGMRSRNKQLMQANIGKETDIDEIGAGNEFSTAAFLTSVDARRTLSKYITSEWAAIAFGFALGNVVTTAAGDGYKHTITFQNGLSAAETNLPSTTIAERIRTGADSVHNLAFLGCVLNSLNLQLGTAPTRESATLDAELVGTGQYVKPSGVSSWPAVLAEHFLPAGTATVTLSGENYTTLKRLFSLQLGVNNDFRDGTSYFPGSGAMDIGGQPAAIRGLMEYGDGRGVTASLRARLTKDSTEFTKMAALTEGSLVVNMPGAVIGAGPETHRLQITLHRVQYGTIEYSETSNIVDVNIPLQVFKDPSNGVMTVEVWNTLAAVA